MIRLALLGLCLSGAAQAAAPCGDEILFLDCKISATKSLTVCLGDGKGRYSYGPAAAPELAMTQSFDEMGATPWPGVSRSIWEEVVFINNGISYAVWHSVDRLTDAHETDGGVVVKKGDQKLAELNCRPDTIEMNAFAVSDAFDAAGYCWQRETQSWHRGCD